MPRGELNIVLRLLWFYFIGLWIGGVWLHVAWFCGITIIGLPICIWMINLVPSIMTLKQQGCYKKFEVGGKTAYYLKAAEQTNFFVRAVYFILVGWWLGLFWIELSLLAAASFIGIPLSFWMINRLPFIITLKQDS